MLELRAFVLALMIASATLLAQEPKPNPPLGPAATPARAEIRQAWTGTEVGYICRRGLIAAMGLSDPPPAAALAELHETIEAPL